jgi:hypothetical protein
MVTNMYNQNVAHQSQIDNVDAKIRLFDWEAKNYGLLDSEVVELKVYAALFVVLGIIYYLTG